MDTISEGEEAPLVADFISAGCILRLGKSIGGGIAQLVSFEQLCVVVRGPSEPEDPVKICLLSSSSSPLMKHLRASNASPFEYLPISQGPSNSPSPPMLLRLLHDRALPSDEILFAITQLVCKVPSTALRAFLPGLPVYYFKLDASSIRKLTAAMYLMPSPPATPVEPSPSWGTALLSCEKTVLDDFAKEPAPAYLPVARVSGRTPAYSLSRSGSLMSRVRAAVSGLHHRRTPS